MATFSRAGQDWRCPRCGRHILLDTVDINDNEHPISLSYARPRWYLARMQTIACRSCHEIVSTFGLYQIHLGTDGQPMRRPGSPATFMLSETYRELVVYPLHPYVLVEPGVVPAAIEKDMQEAAAIIDLSPRAAATLLRRVVQLVMRDFYRVGKKPNLHSEIEAARTKMSTSLYDALMSVKLLGNIGAHPEHDIDLIVDVDRDEAALLLQVVSYLIEGTYVKDAEDEKRLAAIKAVASEKQALRNPEVSS